MKKIVPFILISFMCIFLAACGNEEGKNSVEEKTESTSAVTTTAAATTAAVATTADTTTVKTATTVIQTTAEAATEPPAETEPEEAEEEATEEEITEEEIAGSFDSSDLYVYYGGSSLTVNQDISTFIPASSVDSSPSCYYEGDDKIFHYGDMDVYTYPSGGIDYVLEITLVSPNVSTAKGLSVGMTLDDAVSMYGAYSEGGGVYSWYSGGTYMYVTASGDVITSIGLALQN